MLKRTVSPQFSRDVVNLLVERGMTLSGIARLLRVSKSYISRVKSGSRNFTLDHLARIEREIDQSIPVLMVQAIPRNSLEPELRPLYDATIQLLQSTGS